MYYAKQRYRHAQHKHCIPLHKQRSTTAKNIIWSLFQDEVHQHTPHTVSLVSLTQTSILASVGLYTWHTAVGHSDD